MFSKRLVVLIAALGLATSAQASKFSVTGGGGQLHIGNGLALPIQAAQPSPTSPGMGVGTVFPTLKIPVKAGPAPVITGTVVKPLLFAPGTVMHPATKMGFQRKLIIPAGVLSKPAAQKTVGVKFSNPSAFAVATNLKYTWPAAPAVFSSGAVGPLVVANFGGTMTYSNHLGTRFGGVGQFALSPGVPSGLFPGAPVTVYIKINAATPPCANCLAGIILAAPTGLAAAGGATGMTIMTPGVVIPGNNIANVNMGMTPLGTIIPPAPVLVAMGALPTNMAASQPGPWTTGRIVISNPAAGGGGEMFTIEGKDSRTAAGGGTIQMVSGTLSARAATGANANRGWVRLTLAPTTPVPSMSWLGLSATAGLLVLTFGYTMRRRIFAQG